MDQPGNPDPTEPAPRPEQAPLTNPGLGASLRADYEALQNDMQQATELAAELQRKLSEKSNDFALLKQVFEKSRSDLATMNANITELRQERHRLANEAMRAVAFEMEFKVAAGERDKVRAELETTRASLAAARNELTEHTQASEAALAQLAGKVASLQEQLSVIHRTRAAVARGSVNPEVKAAVTAISEAVERLKNIVGPNVAAPPRQTRRSQPRERERVEEHIDISFGT